MQLRNVAFMTVAAALSVFMLASAATAQQFYAEGQISRTQMQDVDGGVAGAVGGWSGAVSTTLEYDPSIEYGIELGARAIGGTRFRVGLGYSQFEAELDKGTGSAAVSYNGTVLLSAAGSFTGAEAQNAGFNFDNKVKVYSLNGYYDFDGGKGLTPYLGLGMGFARIENAKAKELMVAAHAGVNYDLTESLYIGVRGSVRRIAGPTDKLEINYDDITTWSVGAVLGVKF